MKIAHLKISNILGIAELEFTPAGFTEISGPNGSGKTSVLESVKAAIGSGHDATLVRKGEEKGEIVVVFDNDDQIRKRVTASKSVTEFTQGGVKVQKPSEAIKALTDMMSINPIDFLKAPKKDRVRVLLETMPLEADTEHLQKISGIPVKAQPGVHALEVISVVHKTVYDDRTGTNRAVKEKEATINQMQLALPEAPAGVEGTEDEIIAQVAAATEAKDAELTRVQTKLDGIKAQSQQTIDQIRADAQAKIDAIKAEASAAADAEKAALAEIESKAAQQRERTIAKFTEQVAPHQQALAIIKANRENVAKREQGLATVKKLEEELADLVKDAERQTKALADIEAYKSQLLNGLPIPGLVVRDGEIYRNDIHFDRLNTAQQVDIAVEIAKLRAGDLGVICVDGLELLDPDAFEEFKQRALDSGLQLFVTRVSAEDFSVTTE